MIKGLVGGLRTLVLAFALLFVVLYIIAVFATITIGRGADLDRLDGLRSLFRRRGVAGCSGQMGMFPQSHWCRMPNWTILRDAEGPQAWDIP